MTTNPKGTHMPTDPNRALLQAVDRLTTQVKRIADTLTDGTAQDSFTLAPPVATDDDGAQATGDDTRPLITRTIAHWGPVCEGGRHPAHALQTCDEIDAFTAFLQDRVQQQSAAEWKTTAAVYSGLHTTAEAEVKQLRAELGQLKEQLALKEKGLDELAEVARERRQAIDRVRGVRPSPPRSEFNARTNAQDEGWDQALAAVQAALIGPLAEGS